MGWDIFIQDLPKGVVSKAEIPDDFRPRPLGPRQDIMRKLLAALPGLQLDSTGFGCFDADEFSIEVCLGNKDPTQGVTLFVRGGGLAAAAVATVVEALGGSALDTGSDSGIFEPRSAQSSFAAWQKYRNTVLHKRQ